ncbi:MAG: type II toxin-antitoxin system VapC family toxin [Verrucomicrobiota bacterium]
MKLLLDTHAFIWWDENPSRLGAAGHAACLDPNNELVLSTASIWEMQLKRKAGKLTLRQPLRRMLDDQVQQNGLEIVPVGVEHSLCLDSLPFHHRDPFDRILIATAQVEGWTLVSHDGAFGAYGVPILR